MSKFVHLHVHSHYSLLDGLGKIDELIARAKELDMPALAITDHGNMHGAIEFYTKCKKAGIKPIVGVEAYLSPRGMQDRVPKVDSTAYHQLLLARNEEGYRNLLHLVSEAHCKGMYYKPRIDLALLRNHSRGLVGTSSCLAGMIPEAIVAGDMEKAIALTKQFQDIFDGNFYLELQHHPALEKQMKTNEGLKAIAKELNLPLIATSDVHYVREEDKDTHEVLLAINTGKDLSSDDRLSLSDVNLYMESEAKIQEYFADVPEVVENTLKIAEDCNLELTLGENIIPTFDTPEGFTPDSYLEHLCEEGLKKRYGDAIAEMHTERLRFELDTVLKMGFASYFLIVADYVNWAKNQTIYVGPGRGSAAGSIVAYCLGITDMDPFPYGFLFERFLNPDRISMPDIDMDFADDDRDKVIGYVRQKYGEDHVAGMATFGTMMGRAAVRDVGRVLGVSYGEVDEIAKLVPPPVQGKHIPLKKSLENVPELKARYDADPKIKKLLDFACKLEGTVRHASQHACAFVICKDPTTSYTPVLPAQAGREGVVTQYSMKPIEEIGLLKMDFLGLSNLTIMRNAIRVIRTVYGAEININELSLDDKKTYELLSRGETTGVFQLESDGMKRYIKELKPTEFNDIIAMGALYRPGPMANIPTYIARKHGREKVSYLHPKLANSFASTYGVAVYQEQVMQASKDLAGFTGGQADTLRKAMGKKIAKLMTEMKSKFIDGCKTHSDIDVDLAEKIWKQFEDFAAYGFVKAHAGCYGLISYQTAYLKANYPAAFFAALLTSNADNLDKMAIEMQESAKMGIDVLPPDVNESFPEFGVIRGEKRDYIRFGLAAIKNVGHGVAEKIVEERKANGPFETLTDLLLRLGSTILNKRVLESLAMSGALDRYGERGAMVASVETMIRFLGGRKKDTNQVGLFGTEMATSMIQDIALAEVPPAEKRICLEWEKALLGIYLTGHPLKEIEPILPHIATPVARLSVADNGANQRVGGMVTEMRVINTKNNEAMAFVKIEDFSGLLELVIFPRTWSEAKMYVKPDRYVITDGRVDTRDGSPKIIVSRIMELHPQESIETIKAALGPLPKANPFYKKKLPEKEKETVTKKAEGKSRLLLEIPKTVNKKVLEEIRFIIQAHPGSVPVFIQAIRGDDLTFAKTKSYVKPTQDLLLLLKQAGVNVTLEGIKADDSAIEIETFHEEPEVAVQS